MRVRLLTIGFVLAASLTTVLVSTTAAHDPGRCPNDSKLLNDGPTAVYGEGPGTWWALVMDGLSAAGINDVADQIAYLNGIFGTSFDTLDALRAYNIQLLADTWDRNSNGYVCAFELRGTRAYSGEPLIDLTSFGVSDDKVSKQN